MNGRVLIVIALLLGFTAWMLFGPGVAAPVDPQAVTPAVESAAVPPPAASVRDEPAATRREPVQPDAVATPVPEPKREDAGPRLSGTIVVIELDGRENRQASGEASFVLWSGNSGDGDHVAFEDGKWSLASRPPVPISTLGLSACSVDGAPTYVETDDIPFPHEGAFEFRVRRLPVTMLRVIAADTGNDLNGVTVVGDAEFPYDDIAHPGGRARPITASGRSPLPLPLAAHVGHQKERTLWAVAAGYAWQRARADIASGGEVLVRLEPGGSLECRIVGAALPDGIALRMYGTGSGPPYADLAPDPDGEQRIEGLRPGEYSVRLEKGDWFRTPSRIAEATVTITAGREARVELNVTKAETPPTVGAQLVVRIPPAWQVDGGVRASLQPQGEVERWVEGWIAVERRQFEPTDRDGEFCATLKSLCVGRYMVVITPSEHRQVIEIGNEAENRFVIEVPDPGDVEVRVVDDATNQALGRVNGAWSTPLPPGVNGGGLESMTFVDGVARFRAPVGKLQLWVSADGYAHDPTPSRVVRPGRNEITVRLHKACGVSVTLRDGQATVPLADHDAFSLAPVGHDGKLTARSQRWSHVSRPGRYRLEVKPVAGFASIPPRDVEIPADTIVEVEIELTRQ